MTKKELLNEIKSTSCTIFVEKIFEQDEIYTGKMSEHSAKKYVKIASNYADNECISFLNFVNNIPINIRAKYKPEQLYEAYKSGEKLE